jgi:hypothetical protein
LMGDFLDTGKAFVHTNSHFSIASSFFSKKCTVPVLI